MTAIKSLIASFPGNYPVRWEGPGFEAELRYRTGLTPQELTASLQPLVPDVAVSERQVTVDYGIAAETIAAMRN